MSLFHVVVAIWLIAVVAYLVALVFLWARRRMGK